MRCPKGSNAWIVSMGFVASGCDLVLGVSDLRYERGAEGGAGASSSVGGIGGGGDAAFAADWTGAVDALYTFERAPPELGSDASGKAHDLDSIASPVRDEARRREGEFGVTLDGDDGFESDDPIFDTPDGTSVTFGGWFFVTATDDITVMGKHDNVDGYLLQREANGAFPICTTEMDDTSYFTAFGEADSWPLDTWVHVVCRIDPTASTVAVLTSTAPPLVETTQSARLGDAADPPFALGAGLTGADPFAYVGSLDEIFFVRRALEIASVLRIRACGVDGRGCTCDPGDSTRYLSCGDVACGALPPCDSPNP